MSERTYTTVDKTSWAPGEWQHEPDKVQWVDEATGFDCLAVRDPLGAWCGYVGVPPGHHVHGVRCDRVAVGVHGGLSYAGFGQAPADKTQGVCHVPAPGRPADVWWLGFDCAHSGDLAPHPERGWTSLGGSYRPLAYVRLEIASLAAQLTRAIVEQVAA